jgi:hypothetical protein
MRRWILAGLLLGSGCQTGLVTGYQPRRLGDSPAVRRAYYAGKYTNESRAADQERAEEMKSRRPAPTTPGGPSPY